MFVLQLNLVDFFIDSASNDCARVKMEGKMPNVALTQLQIELIAWACDTAVNEHARFLEDDVRLALAQALRSMGKQGEADLIEPQIR